jgi:hypothetical protein
VRGLEKKTGLWSGAERGELYRAISNMSILV